MDPNVIYISAKTGVGLMGLKKSLLITFGRI